MQISDDQPSEKVISAINERVDEALRMNKKSEYVVVSMAIAIFTLGVAVIIIGYWARNLYISGGATILQGLLYLPVNQTLKLRRDNLILQSVPVMLSSLPPKQAAQQMIKFLEHLRAK